MNENLDLTKILKDCPEGWKFYSSVYGEVKFKGVQVECIDFRVDPDKNYVGPTYKDNPRPIKFIAQCVECCVSSAGEHIKGIGECTFFPSKDQRDWSKFTAPWYKKTEWFNPWRKKDKTDRFDPKTLQPFDKVLVRDGESLTWKINMFSYIDNNREYTYVCLLSCYRYCIPYNYDTKHLVETDKEAPEYYRYWED